MSVGLVSLGMFLTEDYIWTGRSIHASVDRLVTFVDPGKEQEVLKQSTGYFNLIESDFKTVTVAIETFWGHEEREKASLCKLIKALTTKEYLNIESSLHKDRITALVVRVVNSQALKGALQNVAPVLLLNEVAGYEGSSRREMLEMSSVLVEFGIVFFSKLHSHEQFMFIRLRDSVKIELIAGEPINPLYERIRTAVFSSKELMEAIPPTISTGLPLNVTEIFHVDESGGRTMVPVSGNFDETRSLLEEFDFEEVVSSKDQDIAFIKNIVEMFIKHYFPSIFGLSKINYSFLLEGVNKDLTQIIEECFFSKPREVSSQDRDVILSVLGGVLSFLKDYTSVEKEMRINKCRQTIQTIGKDRDYDAFKMTGSDLIKQLLIDEVKMLVNHFISKDEKFPNVLTGLVCTIFDEVVSKFLLPEHIAIVIERLLEKFDIGYVSKEIDAYLSKSDSEVEGFNRGLSDKMGSILKELLKLVEVQPITQGVLNKVIRRYQGLIGVECHRQIATILGSACSMGPLMFFTQVAFTDQFKPVLLNLNSEVLQRARQKAPGEIANKLKSLLDLIFEKEKKELVSKEQKPEQPKDKKKPEVKGAFLKKIGDAFDKAVDSIAEEVNKVGVAIKEDLVKVAAAAVDVPKMSSTLSHNVWAILNDQEMLNYLLFHILLGLRTGLGIRIVKEEVK